MSAQPSHAPVEPVHILTSHDAQRLQTLQVVVKEETPLLPKVAFTLISLASLGGAIFTGHGMGVTGLPLLLRWLTLWTLGLVGGFLVWRLIYLRTDERDLNPSKVHGLTSSALHRADQVALVISPLVALGALGALTPAYLHQHQTVRWLLVAGSLVLAALIATGVTRRATAAPAAVLTLALLVGWAYVDAGTGVHGAVRLIHLTAFSLWLGGALWNINVAIPAGRQHPNVDAVLAGAHQLDRFRWVVRFALPTIIVTGLYMADAYRMLPLQWWTHFPGVLIPLKVLTIIALIVVFIACPLFRQCSPVQGVCNVDDLREADENSPVASA